MIDVIIPVYNQTDLVRACLDSVVATCDPSRHEIIVVDDCSSDAELRSHLSEYADAGSITLITNGATVGFTRSVNRGMKLHADRDVVLLNSDTVVHAGWLDRLAAAAYADTRIATANPLTNASHIGCYPDRVPDGSVRFEISDETLDLLASEANRGRFVDVHTTVGFCMFIKRECLREVGLFDERHFPVGYGEESDFCYRAKKLGWRHVIAGDVFVRHWEGKSFGAKKARLVEQMLDVFSGLHPDVAAKDQSFALRDPVRPLRRALDLARAKRILAGSAALACVVRPDKSAHPVSLVFDPVDCTLELMVETARLPNLPRFRLPAEIASANAMLRRLGVDELRVGSAADRDAIEAAAAGQAFELGLAPRVSLSNAASTADA